VDVHIAEAAERLRYDHGIKVEVDDKTILVVEPVKGDPGLTVLRVLGVAQAAPVAGAAAHGPNGVAAGVWRKPELYVARWTSGRRWVSGYRLTGTSRLSDYVGTEGHVPTRLETGNWYGPVPDEISDLFLEAGILLDDPPFPVPAPPPAPSRPVPDAPPAAKRAAPGRSSSAPVRREPAPRPKASPPRAPAPARPAAARATRVCPSCRMHKGASQFVPGSDLCVDCR
jgi:hypothetical protein